jgi:hypothetical protein
LPTTNTLLLPTAQLFICKGKDLKRNSNYIYRVLLEEDGRWRITAYLDHRKEIIGPQAIFDDDHLPDWIRRDVALLSMVDQMGEIKSIGHRVGSAFWLVSQASKHLLKNRFIQVELANDLLHFGYIKEWEDAIWAS